MCRTRNITHAALPHVHGFPCCLQHDLCHFLKSTKMHYGALCIVVLTRKAGIIVSARCSPFQAACGCHQGRLSSALLTYSIRATVIPRATSTLQRQTDRYAVGQPG